MRLFKSRPVSALCFSSAFALFLGACGISSLGSGATGGGGGGGGGGAGGGVTGGGGCGDDCGPGVPELPEAISSESCKTCHEGIYQEWKYSMHSHAATSPVTIAQVNQAARELIFEADPDLTQFCTNCHGPIAAMISPSSLLPSFSGSFPDKTMNEGISCVTCHKYDARAGFPTEGGGALTDSQNNYNFGPYIFGPFDDAVSNTYHESAQSSLLADDADSDVFCASCHQVGVDFNGDGALRVGQDFVLQNLNQEYLEYRALGGRETCVSCHMPGRSGQAAEVPGAPPRRIRSHVFVGGNYPLDEVAEGVDNLRPYREDLFQSAAQIQITNVDYNETLHTLLSFDITIQNLGAGHNIPSGFTFMRQVWLEVQVTDPEDLLNSFSSGLLAAESNDLCDDNTIHDQSPLSDMMVGCDNETQDADPFLTNLQTKLLDYVQIVDGQVMPSPGAREHWLPLLTGGFVTRVRTAGGGDLSPLRPNETRTFSYPVGPLTVESGSRIKVRLLFRNLPPYMVRKLGTEQPPSEQQLGPLAQHLQVIEMASKDLVLP